MTRSHSLTRILKVPIEFYRYYTKSILIYLDVKKLFINTHCFLMSHNDKLNMYSPSIDSFLLARSLENYNGNRALEIGIGSGIILRVLCKNFKIVAGTDISFATIKQCKTMTGSKAMIVCCDAASAFCNGLFDLIVFNPPYLPNEEHPTKDEDCTTDGGPTGIEVTLHFLESALPTLDVKGRLLIIVSSLADLSKFDYLVSALNLRRRTVDKSYLFFEQLSVIELSF